MLDAANIQRITSDLNKPIRDFKDCFSFVVYRKPKDACYLRKCQFCPQIEQFADYVTELLQNRGISQVIFSLWHSTDRCTLIKQCLSTDDFVAELCTRLETLIPHHFISKNQSKYLSDRKEKLQFEEVLVHTDFSENYSYVVQDAAQQFHYNNNQCTVHPVIFYYRNGDEIMYSSQILLSNSITHDTAAVYVMQEILIPKIRKMCPKVKRIIYVSDDVKQHYKNKFQMCNLVKHKDDFGIEAEWHCHATAHGKGACDGIGAMFKREAIRASLQAQPNKAILDSIALFNWVKNKFKTLKIYYYSEKEHKKIQRHLSKRFSEAPRVFKIQSAHAFSVSRKKLSIFRYSGDKDPIMTIDY